jgi:hypothetical protein
MDSTKRFLVFTYDHYYPGGGMNDFRGSFDTLEEAKEYIVRDNHLKDGWGNIFDCETRQIIEL